MTAPSVTRLSVHHDVYRDSIRQMAATRAMLQVEGVAWAGAFMATPANLEQLRAEGFTDAAPNARANDLVLAVRADAEASAQDALAQAKAALFTVKESASDTAASSPPDLRSALRETPAANVAMISTPGAYAALEAHKALSEGLHVMLFSDGVEIADELALKQRASALGLLVMGPSAGTSWLDGVGFGFSNRVRSGPVGVIAASGTGAQAAMCLLDEMGIGTSHAIGVGSNDLTAEIGGLSAQMALDALEADAQTHVIVLVSKQGDVATTARLLERASKPVVAVVLGTDDARLMGRPNVYPTLEEGAYAVADQLGHAPQDPQDARLLEQIEAASARLSPDRTRVIGLFAGGTLCEETASIARTAASPPNANPPHLMLDLGDEAHTRGRPHPMIDADARSAHIRRQAADPTVAVVLLDIVLGDGAHPDPARVLAPALAEVVAAGAAVVVCVIGAAADPQDLESQRRQLEDTGCILAPTSARAAHAAVAIALRRPTVAGQTDAHRTRS